ncbi:MAG TPA: hypothetical protein VMT57_09545 [Candidatus Thermoplasmatota archaeon]|nr:hypothetical protein [Candidatus Thermoplasmatota archaeon]
MQQQSKANPTVIKLGFWSAVLTAAFAAAFFAVGMFGSSYTENIQAPYVLTAIRPVDYAVWAPGFLLALTFIVLVACIHRLAPHDKKVFSQIGLSFAVIYAGLIVADYFLQWTVILPSIVSNETEALSLFSMYNPHGIFIAFESLGYLIMNVAFLFLAAVFSGPSRLHRAIRWLFIISFILAVGSFSLLTLAGYPIVVFEVVIITIIVVVLIVAGVLLSILFKRTERFEGRLKPIESS